MSGAEIGFFAPGQFGQFGQFGQSVLRAAAAAEQPVTVGELLTVGGPSSTRRAFRGPVFVVTGGKALNALLRYI